MAKPYQLFGYHSTGFRGTGFDASGGILDCPAVRWRDANTDEEDGLEEKLYYLQDFRGDVIGLAEPGTGILEHVKYGPMGRPEAFPAADINFDGKVDAQDATDYDAAYGAWKADHDDYDPRADLNRDGVLSGADNSIFNESYVQFAGLSGNWKLSQGAGLLPAKAFAEGYDNRFGWRGYWYDKRLQEYHVRHRVYDPRQGQWLQTDPIGFAAGDQNLYRYADGGYSTGYDPLGLFGEVNWGYATMDGSTPCPGPELPQAPEATQRTQDWFDRATNFFAGAADGISFGLTSQLRNEWGQSSAVDTQSGWYGAGVGVGVTLDMMIAGGTTGIAYMGTLEGAMVSGALGGLGSNLITQQAQMFAGVRSEYSLNELAGSGFMGAGFGAVGYGASRFVVTPLVRGAVGAWNGLRGGAGAAAGEAVAAQTGNCSRGAAVQRTNSELVQEIADRARAWGHRQGLGSGPEDGTAMHGYAEDLLNRFQRMFGDRGLTAEQRFINGRPWQPGDGLKGSVRLDVIEGRLDNPTHIWDYKFGQAGLTPERVAQIRTTAGVGPTIPIDEVRPRLVN